MSILSPERAVVNGHIGADAADDAIALKARAHPVRYALLSYLEIACFAALCTADMLSTLYWYLHGEATERNPLLSFWLSKSVAAFCIAKLASFVPLLIICAVYRKRYPKLIVIGLRVAMAAYLAIYLVSVGAQLLR